MNKTIQVMLVDDQRLMRDGLRMLLDMEQDIHVVGEASNGEEGVKLYQELKPDVVLMDIRMPLMDGVEAIRQIRNQQPDARLIILTTFDDDHYVFEGLRAGALGYLLKDVSGEELAGAIRTVSAGGALIDPSVTRKVVAEFARLGMPGAPAPVKQDAIIEELTERESEILRLVASGRTNKEIAQELYLAEGTVKNYVSGILTKIQARDRTHAAIRARELNLV